MYDKIKQKSVVQGGYIMRYTRIPYSADCEFEEVSMMFGGGTLRVGKFGGLLLLR